MGEYSVFGISSFYKNITDDPFVYVTGLPFVYKSNIRAIGVLKTLTKVPMMDRDISNFSRLDYNEDNVSIGFLKEAVKNNRENVHLLYWDSFTERLKRVVVPRSAELAVSKFTGNSLRQMISVSPVPSMPEPQTHWSSDGRFQLVSTAPHTTFTAVDIDLKGIPCWYVDFLVFKAQFTYLKDFGCFGKGELRFTNEIAKDYSKEFQQFDRCYSAISPTEISKR